MVARRIYRHVREEMLPKQENKNHTVTYHDKNIPLQEQKLLALQ